MKISKVLNSSVVLAVNDAGDETIILGKGIGYGRKAGQEILLQPSDRVFIPLSNPDAKKMIELFASIPSEYLDITQEIVRDAETTLQTKISPHIYLMLTDHLHFAVERQQQGIVVTNRVFWEIKHFYPSEFAVGCRGLERMREKRGVQLPEEEAANIAFHLVNARQEDTVRYDAAEAAKLIGNIVNIVTYVTHCSQDSESLHYSRFISHMQFFAERFFTGKLLDSGDDFLYTQIQTGYPEAMNCAERIRTYITRMYNVCLPNEETAYLALHIARLLAHPDDDK